MSLLNEYPQFLNRFPAAPDWQAIRDRGAAALRARGLPAPHDGFWRFARLKALEQNLAGLRLAANAPARQALADSYLETRALPHFRIEDGSEKATLVNGQPAGVTWASLDEVVSGKHPESTHWWSLLQRPGHSTKAPEYLEAVAEAHLHKGVLIHVPAHAKLSFGALFDLSTPEIHHAITKVFLVIDEGAEVNFIEEARVRGKAFFGPSLEADVGPGATLRHRRVDLRSTETSTYARARVRVAANATYEHLSLQAGDRSTHQELVTHVNGEGARVALRGLSVGLGTASFENVVAVHHHQPGSVSEQLFKSILAGESRAFFRGEIHIDEGAIHTASNQLSRSLLLSPQCQSITEPVLEIAADDVEAAHGSSTGELSAEEVFYLESRGIDRSVAQRLITLGFVLDILDTLDDVTLKTWARGELAMFQERIFPA